MDGHVSWHPIIGDGDDEEEEDFEGFIEAYLVKLERGDNKSDLDLDWNEVN